ncbi:hypothetical protein VPHK469_0091 [Vibrio phage K469]
MRTLRVSVISLLMVTVPATTCAVLKAKRLS